MRVQRSGNEHILIFDPDDQVLEVLTRYLAEQHITAGRFPAIGGLKRFQLKYFDSAIMQYLARDFDQQVEVLSLVGDVSLRDSQPFIHSHVVLGTADYQAGDVGYVPFAMGHYIENTGDETLTFLEMFRSNRYADVSLAQWLALTPPELVQAHLNVDQQAMAAISARKEKPSIVK